MFAYDAGLAFAHALKDYHFMHGHKPGYFTDEFIALCKDYATDRRYRPRALAKTFGASHDIVVIDYGHNLLEAYYDNDGNVTVRDCYTNNVIVSL